MEKFLDFEVEIGPGSGRVYPVSARSVAGEAREAIQLPFDDLALANQLLTLQNALLHSGGKSRHLLLPEEQSVRDFGRTLFTTLFTGAIEHLYVASQAAAALQGKGLRLRLRILAPEMAALPWEFLYDPSRDEYICLSRNTPVVHYLELPQPPQPLAVTLPLRILVMIATPSNLPSLNVQREQQRMEKALELLQQRGQVQLKWLPGQTWHDVQQEMRSGPWHIFHFIGHGSFDPLTGEGLLAFTDESGQADLFAATQLGRLLADHRPLRLVVLNACEGAKGGQHDIFSSTAAILVRHGIPAVLAMQYAITDAAAITFSRTFYEALSDGLPIDAVVSEARKAVSFEVEDTLEWGVPVLFMHASDGLLFTIEQGGSPAPPQPSPQQTPASVPSPQLSQPIPPAVATSQPRPRSAYWQGSRSRLILWLVLTVLFIVGGGLIYYLAVYQPAPQAWDTATGTPLAAWDCPPNYFCVWSGENGTGARCKWSSDNPDWTTLCWWSFKDPVKSVRNNGQSTNHECVVYYRDKNYKETPAGYIARGDRNNIVPPQYLRSHDWQRVC